MDGGNDVRRRNRVLIVLSCVFGAFLAFEAFTSVVAYTGDAYVRSDLVAVAPQVTGQIVAVHITDNQTVKRGDPLVIIDPVPFQLAVAQRQAEIDEAQAQIAADKPALSMAEDNYSSALAAANFARDEQQRAATLSANNVVSQRDLDRANEQLRIAQAAVDAATANINKVRSDAALHEAALARAEAEMATAQWRLARTRIDAPTDGTINALTVRVGDTARENEPLIGIVDAHAWRVIANYKQDYIRGFHEGGTAWVWLDSEPWHLHRARIAGIARGISRDPSVEKLLPYVAPTTDWIRLQRRFPVTLMLDDADRLTLYMGADARTVIFP
jgi:multidrug efflux system membrane fusion protein